MHRSVVLLATLLLGVEGSADVQFANIFNDHMVLQQQKPIRVWGWADAGATRHTGSSTLSPATSRNTASRIFGSNS
jgi:hypothetical protein